MAKPIILGVRLRGQAAREFDRYMANPDCTERGKELILESARRAEKYRQLYWSLPSDPFWRTGVRDPLHNARSLVIPLSGSWADGLSARRLPHQPGSQGLGHHPGLLAGRARRVLHAHQRLHRARGHAETGPQARVQVQPLPGHEDRPPRNPCRLRTPGYRDEYDLDDLRRLQPLVPVLRVPGHHGRCEAGRGRVLQEVRVPRDPVDDARSCPLPERRQQTALPQLHGDPRSAATRSGFTGDVRRTGKPITGRDPPEKWPEPNGFIPHANDKTDRRIPRSRIMSRQGIMSWTTIGSNGSGRSAIPIHRMTTALANSLPWKPGLYRGRSLATGGDSSGWANNVFCRTSSRTDRYDFLAPPIWCPRKDLFQLLDLECDDRSKHYQQLGRCPSRRRLDVQMSGPRPLEAHISLEWKISDISKWIF